MTTHSNPYFEDLPEHLQNIGSRASGERALIENMSHSGNEELNEYLWPLDIRREEGKFVCVVQDRHDRDGLLEVHAPETGHVQVVGTKDGDRVIFDVNDGLGIYDYIREHTEKEEVMVTLKDPEEQADEV